MAQNSEIKKAHLKGWLDTLSSKLTKSTTLVVCGDISGVLGKNPYRDSLRSIEYTVRFHPQLDNPRDDTVQQLEDAIEKVSRGTSVKVKMSSVNDVRMPFHLK